MSRQPEGVAPAMVRVSRLPARGPGDHDAAQAAASRLPIPNLWPGR